MKRRGSLLIWKSKGEVSLVNKEYREKYEEWAKTRLTSLDIINAEKMIHKQTPFKN